MGSWGTAIFDNDTASDVRGDFRDLIAEGLSPEEATNRLVATYGDDPDFWLGLAVTQWKCGRLQESVRTKALAIIDSDADLRRWDDPRLLKARQAVLSKTRALLESSQPARKRIRKPFKEANDWEIGQLVSYRMASGKHIVLRVIGHGGPSTDWTKVATMDLLDYYDDAAPTFEQARGLSQRLLIEKGPIEVRPLLYLVYPEAYTPWAASEREIPRKRLTLLGVDHSVHDPGEDRFANVIPWRELGSFIERKIIRSIRPGPGGDEQLDWQLGDVLTYQSEDSAYLLFHMVGRHHGCGVDSAPIVVQLSWQETCLPSAEAIESGALVPQRVAYGDFLVQFGIEVGSPRGFVLVHDDEEAVNGSSFQRIGNFRPNYFPDIDRFRFASVPMVVRGIEQERAKRKAQPAVAKKGGEV